ncbi:MAG: PKD-like domain-containing protein, partial [Bacteroidota bacterium]
MKKIYLLLVLCCLSVVGMGQVTLISPTGDGGFETSTTFAGNGWTVVNPTTVINQWICGATGVPFAGSRVAYISNNGSTYNYTKTATRTAHFYRDVAIPTGASAITLSFQWKSQGESGYDRLIVYRAPTTVTPVANVPASTSTTITGATQVWLQPSLTSSYTSATVTLPSTLAGTTVRLIFTWQNDNSAGTSPPGAIDNISLTYVPSPTITATPTPIAFGSVTTGTNSSPQTISISGSTLTPASGSLTVAAPANFQVSNNGTSWTTSYTIGYSASTLSPTTSYIRFNPTAVTSYSGNVTVSGGSATTANVAVSGTGAAACSGTPTPGTVSPSVASGCGSFATTLSLAGATSAGGISYQWAVSSTGTSGWSNISGATNSTYSLTVSSAQYYRATLTCAGSPATTPAFFLAPSACINMPTSGSGSAVTSCSGTTNFYSSNGATGSYTNSENGTYTFYPAATGYKVRITFSAFSTESGWDYFRIYDGSSTGATLLSTTSGATAPAAQTSTAANGALTFNFTSDGSGIASGWTAAITNIAGSPITTQPATSTTVCAGSSVSLSVGTLTGTLSYMWYNNGTTNSTTGGTATGVTTSTFSPSTSTAGTTYYYCVVTNECAATYTTTTAAVTVNPNPAAIAGNVPVCNGSSITLTDATSGGTWTSGTPGVATITATGGVLAGLSVGNSIVTYTLPTGCFITATATVNATPVAISGNTGAICVANTMNLANASGSGTWTSGSSNATVDGSGVVTGVSAGTAIITFTLSATGCKAFTTVTVNALPATIGGTLTICPLLSTTLTNSSGTGTWSSSNATIADIGESTGVLTGVAAGTATITFTLAATGCRRTGIVTVNASPAAIAGDLSACVMETSTLSNATSGGTWSSSNPTIASVSSAGVVTAGATAGTATISYIASGCPALATFVVNGSPDPTITGTTILCTGTTTTLANAGGVGSWTSGNPGVAIAGITTGIITGATAGTATISYSNGCGTPASIVVTVNQTPTSITGADIACIGTTATYANGVTGGTWSSSATGVATITAASGVLTPVAAGTAILTYTLSNGCVDATKTVTVQAVPGSISGTTTICSGATSSLTNSAAGGTWSSSDAAIATIGSSNGVATGVAQGTATVTYTNGCGTATQPLTIKTAPAAITGSSIACLSSTTTLANTSTGGTWSSSAPTIASVNSTTGVVSGLSIGTAVITYANGCTPNAMVTISVSSSSGSITGTTTICQGATTVLSSSPSGGTWSSSNAGVASVSTSGVVTGVNNGTATITYSSGCGTPSTATITVNSYASCATTYCAPAANCADEDMITNITFAGINNTTGCSNLALYTTPVGAVTQGTSSNLTMVVPNAGFSEFGAVWIDYNHNGTFDASEFTFVGSGTGFTATVPISIPSTALPGITRMRARVRYNATLTSADACLVYTYGETEDYYVNISCNIAAITGTTTGCIGSNVTLADATSGGNWTSGNTAVAAIGSTTGVVTGLSAGTAAITYRIPGTGCAAFSTVTITQPVAITGTASVCAGSTTTLSNSSGSGTWSSSNPSVAGVGLTSGVVTGVLAGTTTITFTLTSTGCTRTTTVTVNALPASISGSLSTCDELSTTLSNTSGTGTWASSNAAVATIGTSTGIATGISTGTATITFTLAATGCKTTSTLVVNPSPAPIAGTLSACITASSSLSSTTTGGTWSSSTPAIATVNSTGVVTAGAVAGTTTISYSVSGCPAVATFAVNGSPGAITGTATVCSGNTTTLFNFGGVGSWTSSDIAVATVGTGGVVTGVSAGTAVISYSNGCGTPATKTVTVNETPAAISGTDVLCLTATSTLSTASTGGTWSSGNTSVATIGASSGIVSPVSAGIVTISYSLGNGCASATLPVTINGGPAAITGANTVCVAGTTALSNATSGGSWTSSATGVATIGSGTGVVTGIAIGTAMITYNNGCGTATTTVTVSGAPSAITGGGSICAGGSVALGVTGTGGTWSSTTPSVATVNSAGVVTGVAAGATTISYTNSCGSAGTAITVSGSITPITISPASTATVCLGGSTSFTASGSSFLTNVVDQDFSSLTGAVGGTWTITNIAGVAASYWQIRSSPGYSSVTSGDGTPMMEAAPDATTGTTNTIVTSPIFSLVGYSTATLTLNEYFQSYTADATVQIQYSINGGSSWFTLVDRLGTSVGTTTWSAASPNTSISLTALLGQANVRLRWNYVSTYGFYWAIDNVKVSAAASPSYTWAGSAGASGLSCTSCATTTITPTATGTNVYSVTASGGGCTAISGVTVSVNPLPATVTVTGGGTACGSLTLAAANGSDGTIYFQGTTSNGTSTATASTSQVISTSGTYYFRARSAAGCWGAQGSAAVIINPVPTASVGNGGPICDGATATLTATPSGGVTAYSWSGPNLSSSTLQNPTATPTVTSTYSLTVSSGASPGCSPSTVYTTTVTVNPQPAAVTVTGGGAHCATATIAASNGGDGTIYFQGTTAGGTSTAAASSSEVITTSGTYYFRARSAAGCWGPEGSVSVTINPLPASITGVAEVCAGSATTLANTTPGGAWSSSDTSVAAIGSGSGIVSGIASGTVNITYTLPTGCSASIVVTVNNTPEAIIGTPAVCQSASITLVDMTFGGSWSSSATAVAGINATTGVVEGYTPGTTTISFTLSTGCAATTVLTVNALPDVIVGGGTICEGVTITLTNETTGGTWSTAATSVVSVGSATGIVTGLSMGAAPVSYTLATGCYVTTLVSVNPTPAAIAGTPFVCTGTTITLTDTYGGGSWSSSNSAVATIGSSTGEVYGVAAGTSIVSYALATGCYRSVVVTVNPTPNVLPEFSQTACNGAATIAVTFSGAIDGTVYNWVNDNTSIGIGASGAGTIPSFTAVNTGTSFHSGTFTVTPSAGGCTGSSITLFIGVNPTPTVATVSDQTVCNGASTAAVTFSGDVSGTTYSWTNGNASIGLATSGTGTIASFTATNSGTTAQTATITVTPSANGCAGSSTTFTINVNPTPTVATVSNQTVCNGASTAAVSFSGGVSGTTYSWTNSNTSIGLATSGTGTIAAFTATNSGTAAQSATITVTPSANGCTGSSTTFTINVNPTPTVATVSDKTVCNGASTAAVTFSGGVSGTTYSWTNSNASIGLATSGTGTIASFAATNSGTTAQSATITVTPSANGCTGNSTTFTINVNPTPTVATVSDQTLCNGASTAAVSFSGGVDGTTYSWTNSNTSIGLATSGTGTIAAFTATNSGTTAQSATITVTPSANGCTGSSTTFTINVNPTPTVATVSNQTVCNGASTAAVTFSGGVSGTTYSWTNSNASIGLATSGTGTIAAFAATNSGTTAQSAIITVTPSANGCTGSSTTFTINVNPTPTVATVSDQTLCNGASTAAVTFSGGVSGTTYSWTNSNASIGLATSGTGTIAAFTATNSGTAAQSATITVTPSANSCTGSSTTFTINVNPTPTVATVSNQTVCNGASTAAV